MIGTIHNLLNKGVLPQMYWYLW